MADLKELFLHINSHLFVNKNYTVNDTVNTGTESHDILPLALFGPSNDNLGRFLADHVNREGDVIPRDLGED